MFDKTHGNQIVREAASKYELNEAVDYLDSLPEDKRKGKTAKAGLTPGASFATMDVESI